MEKHLIRLDIEAPYEAYDEITGLLTLMVSTGWEEQSLASGDILFRVHCDNAGLIQDVEQAVLARVAEAKCTRDSIIEQDWLNSWKEYFTPVPCGKRFVVLPPWLKEQAARDYAGRIPIVIEPRSAFGTGHHTTTALCLGVLSDLLDAGTIKSGQNFLDLGTGSGVLGLGLALSGLTGEGYDIDPLSMDNATENRDGNGIAKEAFALGLGSIEKAEGKKFSVVVANILAGPLIEMAHDVAECVQEGGVLVLSGILAIQADKVSKAYMAQGLASPAKVIDGEWACLYWK